MAIRWAPTCSAIAPNTRGPHPATDRSFDRRRHPRQEAAQIISQRLTTPVIGIGSGRYCDGQILVVNDLLGLNDDVPLPAKAYISLNGKLRDIFTAYRREVEAGQFPAGDNAVHMEPGKLQEFQDLLGEKHEV